MISNDIMSGMPNERTPLFVRLPRNQAAALDRLADATGRRKQTLVSELLADRLTFPHALPIGRADVTHTAAAGDEVISLEELATLLKIPVAAVRSRAEAGELPGRRFGKEWRFSRLAVLDWLSDGDTPKRVKARREA